MIMIFLKNLKLTKKSISPLIATILLVVVAVALIALVLTWGKDFTNESLSETNTLENFNESDIGLYLTIEDGINGRYFVMYRPPPTFTKDPFTVTHYSLIDTEPIPLEPPVTVKPNSKTPLDLGIVDKELDLVLYLENGGKITEPELTHSYRKTTGDCPEGFSFVPANHLYPETLNGSKQGFCISTYEMKVDQDGDGLGDVNTDCVTSTSYDTWDNTKSGCSISENEAVSTPEGYPVAEINLSEANSACESLGGHVMTMPERMTVLRNLERVPENWSSGEVGTGYLFTGHNDNDPSEALEADSNHLNGYYLTGNTSNNQKRVYQLDNGEYIWDFSGNVWEWVDYSIDYANMPLGFDSSGNLIELSYGSYDWFSYNPGDSDVSGRYIDWTNLGEDSSLLYKDLYGLSPDYNVDNGIGRIRLRNYNDRVPLAGGTWNNGTAAGPFALNLTHDSGNRNLTIGVRCVVV